ncbi:MAG: tagaturonate epimerase family protein [Caldilineaceae bacterium]
MTLTNFSIGTLYPMSIVTENGTTYALAKLQADGAKRLVVAGDQRGFVGVETEGILLCEQTPKNLFTLRERLPWLLPQPLGQQKSFGFGDRIGLATPGHVAAMRAAGDGIAPIFAQQSVRENTRIGRTAQQVLDDATWGVFESGWRDPWGADADHVKEVGHLPAFIVAGYTFYTIDPSDHVDNEAQTDTLDLLRQKADRLPWVELATDYPTLQQSYCTAPFALAGQTLTFDEETLLRALAKYGRAVAHTVTITRAIERQLGGQPFDLEMSVDETDTPTSAHEHFFIANELIRRNVPVVSLAPRFVGKFQKGVDYMGDLDEFEVELAKHVAIMRHFGRYKLSVHTGSDKFSIYGIVNRQAGGLVHVKTAGTSYLEALRVMAVVDPALFRQILTLGHERFAKDRKSYFLDCRPEQVPQSEQLRDEELPALLDQFDARQLLHVTFGSALDEYGDALKHKLAAHEQAYRDALVAHFRRHLEPFTD